MCKTSDLFETGYSSAGSWMLEMELGGNDGGGDREDVLRRSAASWNLVARPEAAAS